MSHHGIIHSIANGLLNGDIDERRVIETCATVFGKKFSFAKTLANRVAAKFKGRRPKRATLEKYLGNDKLLDRAINRHFNSELTHVSLVKKMVPAAGAPKLWSVPSIESVGELARWIGVHYNELFWFADLRSMETKRSIVKLSHYHRRWIPKRNGQPRLIEAPKATLKEIQRNILHGILEKIPVHEAVHGFCKGRSTSTFATPHVGRQVVLRMDLKDFFVRIGSGRIIPIFLTAGYPECVAELLSAICCTGSPAQTLLCAPCPMDWPLRKILHAPHLPQGAPTSPALANLAAFRLDCRLSKLTLASGGNYTRYADDLTFSGDEQFARSISRFQTLAATITMEEGFHINHHKTRIMFNSVSQRSAGLVLNECLNIPRKEYDTLKAILHNCVKFGPESQNRENHPNFSAHLNGRISYVASISKTKGMKLTNIFEKIRWMP